jgi:hypothetical protein
MVGERIIYNCKTSNGKNAFDDSISDSIYKVPILLGTWISLGAAMAEVEMAAMRKAAMRKAAMVMMVVMTVAMAGMKMMACVVPVMAVVRLVR